MCTKESHNTIYFNLNRCFAKLVIVIFTEAAQKKKTQTNQAGDKKNQREV